MTSLRTKTERQRGVTLLMSIMILAALTAIVFSLSAVAINELKTSANVTNTEPAIIGAEAVAEDLMFQYTRGTNPSCNTTSTATLNYLSTGANVSVSSVTSYYYDGAQTFALSSGGEQDLYMYNPCSPGTAPGYESLTVQLGPTSGASAVVNVCTWASTTCSASSDLGMAEPIASGGAYTFSGLDPGTQYQMAIENNGSAVDQFSLTTTSNNPSVITGMPATQVTIQTTGSKGGQTRKLQTTLPQ